MYSQKNYLRFIALYLLYTLQGEDCYCYADIGTESTLMDQVASSQCNIACAGNPGQKCGGATAGTVLVAKCEQGWTRFGEKCLKEVTFDNLDSEGLKFTDGIQTCAAVSPFFSKLITSYVFCLFSIQVAHYGFHHHKQRPSLLLTVFGPEQIALVVTTATSTMDLNLTVTSLGGWVWTIPWYLEFHLF